jgi:hypothetical protein
MWLSAIKIVLRGGNEMETKKAPLNDTWCFRRRLKKDASHLLDLNLLKIQDKEMTVML